MASPEMGGAFFVPQKPHEEEFRMSIESLDDYDLKGDANDSCKKVSQVM
jgi:hypothetical protein